MENEEKIKSLIRKKSETEERIQKERLDAWQSYSAPRRAGCFDLVPLTIQAWVDLTAANNGVLENPFNATTGDLLAYIWRNLPDWDCSTEDTKQGRRRFAKFCKVAAKQPHKDVLIKVAGHYLAAIQDSPVGGASSNERSRIRRQNKTPYLPNIAVIIDILCHEYGQNPSEVMGWTVQRAFQLLRAIRLRYDPDLRFPDHPEIDIIKTEYLKLKNAI